MNKQNKRYGHFSHELIYPLTVSEVLALAMAVNLNLFECFESIEVDRQPELKTWQQLINLQQDEFRELHAFHNHQLNYDIGRFYESGGQLMDLALKAADFANHLKTIEASLVGFSKQIDLLTATCQRNASSSIELMTYWRQMREFAADFFAQLSAYYPAGPVAAALLEISDLFNKNTIDFSQESVTIAV